MDQQWPLVDEAALEREQLTLVVQVNGKLRGRIQVTPGLASAQVQEIALKEPNVMRFVEGKQVRKVVVVPDKLVNIVVGA